MPLSKAKNAERMRQLRLHAKNEMAVVQPAPIYDTAKHKAGDRVRIYRNGRYETVTVPKIDADGGEIW